MTDLPESNLPERANRESGSLCIIFYYRGRGRGRNYEPHNCRAIVESTHIPSVRADLGRQEGAESRSCRTRHSAARILGASSISRGENQTFANLAAKTRASPRARRGTCDENAGRRSVACHERGHAWRCREGPRELCVCVHRCK